MKSGKIFFTFSLVLIVLVACSAKRNLFVLLPDEDGKVGTIEVANKGGTQIVSEDGYATQVVDANVAPGTPFQIDKKEVSETFKDALEMMPEPPVRFLLYFKSDTTTMNDASEKLVPNILATIKKRRSSDISVIGHTDRFAPDRYNLYLSLKRAERIRGILISNGVDADMLEVTYHGEKNPLIETKDNVRQPLNRRVEVIVR